MHHRRALESDDTANADSEPLMMGMPTADGGIAAEQLLDAHPEPFHGYCQKKNNSILARLFPCWVPKWKNRFFVLSGSYLFRYEDRSSENVKGVPLPLDCCQFKALDGSLFEIDIIRKSYVLDAGTVEKRDEWLHLLKVRKLEAIRENMGHAPISAAVRRTNAIAKAKFERRIRIDHLYKIQEMNSMSQILGTQTSQQFD